MTGVFVLRRSGWKAGGWCVFVRLAAGMVLVLRVLAQVGYRVGARFRPSSASSELEWRNLGVHSPPLA